MINVADIENKIINADCMNILKQLPDKCIDMILCDLPYGILNRKNESTKWDTVIPFDLLWESYERIIKDNGAIVLTASGMFTADLMVSNKKLWRYNLIWKKGNRVSDFFKAKKQPLRNHEDICVFFKKQPTYNPQMRKGEKNHKSCGGNHEKMRRCYGNFKEFPTIQTNEKYPISVIDIDKEFPQIYHPTQKPVALFEYLIKTYTQPNEIVLDNCSGSGTTAIACLHTGRRFICIEKDKDYWQASVKRLEEEQRQGTLF